MLIDMLKNRVVREWVLGLILVFCLFTKIRIAESVLFCYLGTGRVLNCGHSINANHIWIGLIDL